MEDVRNSGRDTVGVSSFVPVDENRSGQFAHQTNDQQRSALGQTVDAGARRAYHGIVSYHATPETVHARETESVQIRPGI